MDQVLKYLLLTLALIFLSTGCSNEEEVSTDEEIIQKELSLEEEDSRVKITPYATSGRSIDIEYDGENLWVAHYEDSLISKIDRSGKTVKTIEVQGEPIKLTFDGEFMWVSHFTEPIVTKMSLAGEILELFDTGESPGSIFRENESIWVANGMSNFISKISRSSGETLAEYPVGGGEMPGPFAMEYDGENLWVANYFENTVERLNLQGEVLQTINPGFDPVSLEYDGENLWVVLVDEDSIASIDDEGDIESVHPVPNGPRQILYDNESLWVVSFDEKKLSRLNLGGEINGEITLDGGPWAMDFDGENLWVVDSTAPIIWKVGPVDGDLPPPAPFDEKYYTLDEIKSLPHIVSTPDGFFSSPVPSLVVGNLIWLSLTEENRIALINQAGEELQSIKIESEAADMKFDGNFVWIAQPSERSISKYTTDGDFVYEYEVSTRPTKMVFVGENIWFVSTEDDSLTWMSKSGDIGEIYLTGGWPTDVLYDGEFVWTSNARDKSISRITLDGEEIKTYRVGDTPLQILYADHHGGGHIWVLNYGDNTLMKLTRFGMRLAVIKLSKGSSDLATHQDKIITYNPITEKFKEVSAEIGGTTMEDNKWREPSRFNEQQ